MLEAVGLNPEDDDVYLLMLREPDLSLGVLACRLGRAADDVAAAILRLEAAGLVSRSSHEASTWRPARPDVAVDVLVSRRRADLDQLREAASEWAADMAEPDRYKPERLVEIVVGRQAIATRFAQLMHVTEFELLVLDRPPYASVPDEADRTVRELLRSGVEVRGIYSPDSLQMPCAVDEAHSAVEAGERSRIHPDLPMKLAIGDRRQALLPLAAAEEVDSALVVHSSALLDALVRMFELLWVEASPIVKQEDDELDARLVTMLTAGMKDDAIARRLGVSPRTVGRRVARLMELSGAQTRFQAGAYAERRSTGRR